MVGRYRCRPLAVAEHTWIELGGTHNSGIFFFQLGRSTYSYNMRTISLASVTTCQINEHEIWFILSSPDQPDGAVASPSSVAMLAVRNNADFEAQHPFRQPYLKVSKKECEAVIYRTLLSLQMCLLLSEKSMRQNPPP
jgi:hypothetical protein